LVWLPWILAGLLGVIALGLAWGLARASAGRAQAEHQLADAARLLEHVSLTSEW